MCEQVKAKCKTGKVGWGQIVQPNPFMDAKLRFRFVRCSAGSYKRTFINPKSEQKEDDRFQVTREEVIRI